MHHHVDPAANLKKPLTFTDVETFKAKPHSSDIVRDVLEAAFRQVIDACHLVFAIEQDVGQV
jgi:hypothetical protein